MSLRNAARLFCVLSAQSAQHAPQIKEHELRKKYWDLFSRLGLSFALLKDVKFSDLCIVGDSILFSVMKGSWFSFLPYPDMVDPGPVSSKSAVKSNVHHLSAAPENDEEAQLLRIYRSLSPMQKDTIRTTPEAAENLQKEYEDTVTAVMDGKPLDDEQARCWSWLRGKVISGEFCFGDNR